MARRVCPLLLPFLIVVLAHPPQAQAQTDRTQMPALLARGIVEFSVGHLNFPFSSAQLEPGHTVDAIDVPTLGVRLSLGYRINERLTAQMSYMRPARWVSYQNINGDQDHHSVWMNVVGMTLKGNVPLWQGLSAFGEGGLGLITRHGITFGDVVVVKDAVHVAPLVGAGLEYALATNWSFAMGATYAPARADPLQPQTLLYSGGLIWRAHPTGAATVPIDAGPAAAFPTHLFQIGYTTSAMGYGLNQAVAPIFWQGDIAVSSGLNLLYSRNIFHTRRLFSLDWGASVATHRSEITGDHFLTASLFPVFRFTPIRTSPADLYFLYSLAGPTFISKKWLDHHEAGGHFTMQDLVGFGLYLGKHRQFNAEVRVGHYSNGNLLPRNTGIKVPLTFSLGYAR